MSEEDDTWEGKWKRMKGTFKEHWGRLTDDDIKEAEGSRDKMVGKIQQRYGESKEWASEKLKEYENRT